MSYQIVISTEDETPWSTRGKSCASPLWNNGLRLHGGNPIDKDEGAVYQAAVFVIVCPASDAHGSDITYK
jgi:hypothetical protein